MKRAGPLRFALTAALLGLAPLAASQDYGAPPGAGGSDAKPPDAEQQSQRRSWGRKGQEGGWAKREDSMDPRTAKRYAEALEHLQAERYDECEKALGKLRLRGLNALERAKVYRTYAFVAYGRGDLARARDYLEKALAEEGLPLEDQAQARFQIAQLYLAEESWTDVVSNLEKWFEIVEKPNSAAYYLLAIAHYQLEDLDAALVPAQKAIDIAEEPQEGWLQLLLALRLTRKEYQQSVPLLEELVRLYPKKTYWIQLSTVHGALGNYSEALVPLQLAYTQGLLTEGAELRRLAELMLFLDLPFRAAEVLSKGLGENRIEPDTRVYELLSNSRIAAREYEEAVGPLGRAAELAENGDLYVRLAQVHLQREKWAEAVEALVNAIDKGELGNPGDARLLMGIAIYSQKQPRQALRWFREARDHTETRDEAKVWLQHIGRELQTG